MKTLLPQASSGLDGPEGVAGRVTTGLAGSWRCSGAGAGVGVEMGVGDATCTGARAGFCVGLFVAAGLGVSGLSTFFWAFGAGAGTGSGTEAGTTGATTGAGGDKTGAMTGSGAEAVAVGLTED